MKRIVLFICLFLILCIGFIKLVFMRSDDTDISAKARISIIKLQAEFGNVKAQDIMGNIYLFGQGVPQDCETAILGFKKQRTLEKLKHKFC